LSKVRITSNVQIMAVLKLSEGTLDFQGTSVKSRSMYVITLPKHGASSSGL